MYSAQLGDESCRIHQLHIYRGINSLLNEYPRHDSKRFDGKAAVMLEFWGMWSTPSLPLLPGPL